MINYFIVSKVSSDKVEFTSPLLFDELKDIIKYLEDYETTFKSGIYPQDQDYLAALSKEKNKLHGVINKLRSMCD